MITASAGGAAAGIGSIILILFLIALGLAAYLAPGIVASVRHVPNQGSVWAINVLFGWSLLGWGIAMAMACRSRYQTVVAPYVQQLPPPPPPASFNQYPPAS